MGAYEHLVSIAEAAEEARRVAQWYANIAAAYEALVALAEARPAGAVVGGPDLIALRVETANAQSDARLHAVDNPSHRPVWRGDYRNWLARETAEALKRHEPGLKGEKLLQAIAEVLKRAGASFPDLHQNKSKFYRMLRAPGEGSVARAEARAAAAKERFGDRPI